MPKRRSALLPALLLLSACAALAAAGCDGDPSTTTPSVAAKQNPPGPAQTPGPQPTPAPTAAPGSSAGAGTQTGAPSKDSLDQDEQQMLVLINQHRAENGAGPLRVHSLLVESSRWLSQDMAARNYLSHTDSLGRDSFQRMDLFGFALNGWRGENIACGNGGAGKTYLQWLYSPGHDANMLNPRYTYIGIARAYDADSRFGWYWTTDFGSGD